MDLAVRHCQHAARAKHCKCSKTHGQLSPIDVFRNGFQRLVKLVRYHKGLHLIMMGHSANEKALRYIAQLDEARCAGRWKDVPELCRKVEKHAPNRRCLTLTARSEARIAAFSIQRPATAASEASAEIASISPILMTAIDEENQYAQDTLQAIFCLAWLHYVLEEPGLTIARLPDDIGTLMTEIQGASPSAWSRVCIVKGSFLKGSSLEKTGSIQDAVSAYFSIVPWLSHISFNTETPQFRRWTEQLLVRLCCLCDQSAAFGKHSEAADALRVYRIWSKYCESTSTSGRIEGPMAAQYRRLAWKAYYDTLSIIAREDLAYDSEAGFANPSNSMPTSTSITRLLQRSELKKVEDVYENLLLTETSFPKATDQNAEITEWTESVMCNWRFFGGQAWSDADLGQGGKEAMGRGVLDILYRAATKTFQSTTILRSLCEVHASLAEFMLALKAYDSYVEIIIRDKDRAGKSGYGKNADKDNDILIQTSCEVIRFLCRFGSRTEAEKAINIGETMEEWLHQSDQASSSSPKQDKASTFKSTIKPESVSDAYYAIGISQAHWAHFTHDADGRNSNRAHAILNFRKALSPNLEQTDRVETLYALALVLAEIRDITGALKAAKQALSNSTNGKLRNSVDRNVMPKAGFGRERKLVAVWHLLGLLLTARSEFAAAERACDAAFEQFGDPTFLFGRDSADIQQVEHLEKNDGWSTPAGALADEMGSFEKDGILQIRMTQLALIEVLDGPVAAVDGCDELLALYARLFGSPQLRGPSRAVIISLPEKSTHSSETNTLQPKSSLRSLKSTKHSDRTASIQPSYQTPEMVTAPAIEITDEDASKSSYNRHLRHLPSIRHRENKSGVRRSPSQLLKRSSHSLRGQTETAADSATEAKKSLDEGPAVRVPRSDTIRLRSPGQKSSSNSLRPSMETAELPLRSLAQNTSSTPKSAAGYQSSAQGMRPLKLFLGRPHIPSDPHFSILERRRYETTVLVSIWSFVSGLYSRAEMHDDARAAMQEAHQLVHVLENEVLADSPTSRALSDRGWGGGKSVEELWADVFALHGQLLVAQGLHHEARVEFERAVLHFPNHREAIVGLSGILLDIYCEVIPQEPFEDNEAIAVSLIKPTSMDKGATGTTRPLAQTPSSVNQLSPPDLYRLAARDRAFGLLSTLTKLSSGCDCSDAWFALARASEESGQLEKTKDILWWCVELEETRPIRPFTNVRSGGFVL